MIVDSPGRGVARTAVRPLTHRPVRKVPADRLLVLEDMLYGRAAVGGRLALALVRGNVAGVDGPRGADGKRDSRAGGRQPLLVPRLHRGSRREAVTSARASAAWRSALPFSVRT